MIQLTILISLFSYLRSIEFSLNIEKIKNKHIIKDLIYTNFEKTLFDLKVIEGDVYTLLICIGEPQQCFNVVVDTGSFHLWVPNIDCSAAYGKNRYDPNISKFYSGNVDNKIMLSYGSGDVSGYLAKDIVSSFDSKLLFTWVSANKVLLNIYPFDGILGLGRKYKSMANKEFSIMDFLIENKLINSNVISMKREGDNKGKLVIGEIHEDFKSDYPKCNIFSIGSHKDLWGCRLSYILHGNNPSNNTFYENAYSVYDQGYIDSGTTSILAPFRNIKTFLNILTSNFEIDTCKIERDYTMDVAVITCNNIFKIEKIQDIYLVFNGFAFKIDKNDLFQAPSILFDGYILKIIFTDKVDFWVIGQTFMKNYHILFNNEENYIGFKGQYLDFRGITNDNDFLFSDYVLYFLLGFLIIFIIFIMIIVLIRNRKIKKQNDKFIINNPDYIKTLNSL